MMFLSFELFTWFHATQIFYYHFFGATLATILCHNGAQTDKKSNIAHFPAITRLLWLVINCKGLFNSVPFYYLVCSSKEEPIGKRSSRPRTALGTLYSCHNGMESIAALEKHNNGGNWRAFRLFRVLAASAVARRRHATKDLVHGILPLTLNCTSLSIFAYCITSFSQLTWQTYTRLGTTDCQFFTNK